MRNDHLLRFLQPLTAAVLAIVSLGAAGDDGRPGPTVRVETRVLDEVYAADAIIEAVRQATIAAQIVRQRSLRYWSTPAIP